MTDTLTREQIENYFDELWGASTSSGQELLLQVKALALRALPPPEGEIAAMVKRLRDCFEWKMLRAPDDPRSDEFDTAPFEAADLLERLSANAAALAEARREGMKAAWKIAVDFLHVASKNKPTQQKSILEGAALAMALDRDRVIRARPATPARDA